MAAVCGQTYVWPGAYDRFLTSHIAATSLPCENGNGRHPPHRNISVDKLIPDPPNNTTKPYTPNTMFMIVPDMDTESLLAHACESLASANVMASDFATFLTGPQRNMALAIAQIIMLAELAVNRALDNVDPQ
jgi:hypothetical protein